MHNEERKISNRRLVQIIIVLFCFLILSLFLNLLCLMNFVKISKQVSEIGAENIELQNQIEYYKITSQN